MRKYPNNRLEPLSKVDKYSLFIRKKAIQLHYLDDYKSLMNTYFMHICILLVHLG